MNVSINFLHGYIKFKETDEEWTKISAPGMWLDGGYDELDRIMKQQKVFAWLLELIPCPEGIKPLPQGQIAYIEKGE